MLTPEPPYFAVIFSSCRTDDNDGYAETAARMEKLAAAQPGYLGHESVRDPASGLGITVSYWRDEESISNWKRNAEHLEAQRNGRKWYSSFTTRVCRVERESGYDSSSGSSSSG